LLVLREKPPTLVGFILGVCYVLNFIQIFLNKGKDRVDNINAIDGTIAFIHGLCNPAINKNKTIIK
jgi:hypothetical protein